MRPVRTRFAPSPTGSLHVGGVRTALYCWLFARKHGGQFILRIEDTDRARSTEESAREIVRDMKWLGLEWDEGPEVEGPYAPYSQSARLDRYEEAIRGLIDADSAYWAWESREELTAMRAVADANKENFRFRRREPYTEAEIATFHEEKRIPVVRLKAPDHSVTVTDVVKGEMTQEPAEIEDVVIRKGDGFPTYHFAVVVDDDHMQITHVMRGQEHHMNTVKHLAIQEALGVEAPTYAHLPTIHNMGGGKMSKRDKARIARDGIRKHMSANGFAKGDYAWLAERIDADLDDVQRFMKKKHDSVSMATAVAAELDLELPLIEVMDYRKAGILAEALLNYLALLGWSAGDDREYYPLDELAQAFTLERVNRQPAKFDPVKLEAMNAEYMRTVSDDRYREALGQWFEVVQSPLARLAPEALDTVIALFRSRARTFRDLEVQSQFLRAAPREYNAKAVKKHIEKGGGLAHLTDVRTALADTGRWETPSIERSFTRLCESTGTKLGKYAQPVRIAISGGPVTPPLFDTLSVMDREDVVARIDRAIEAWTPAE